MTMQSAASVTDDAIANRPMGAIRSFFRRMRGTTHSIHQSERKDVAMNAQTEIKAADNGVNVEALLGAREAITGMPAAGQFKWRTRCDWIDGVHTQSTVDGFFGLGAEQERNARFEITTDHPEQFAAKNQGATPIEIVLSALGACLTGGVASVTQHRGIQLRKVTAFVEGDMDLAGVLGIDADVRNGFSGIRVRFEIDADATPEEIAAVVAQSQKRSAVFDIIANPGNVSVTVA